MISEFLLSWSVSEKRLSLSVISKINNRLYSRTSMNSNNRAHWHNNNLSLWYSFQDSSLLFLSLLSSITVTDKYIRVLLI